MKILFLTNSFYPDIGGIEAISELLASAFYNAGHEVHLITWSQDNTGRKFPFTIIRVFNYTHLFKEHNWADLIFENNPCLKLSWPGVFFKKPSFVGLHTWISGTDGKIRWQDRLKLRWLRRASKVIACSDAIRERCWPSAIIIGNTYNTKLFKANPHIKKTKDFVFLGRLVSDKGADMAIKAFHDFLSLENQYKSTSSALTFTIIGQGPERERLQVLVNQLALQNNVFFTESLTGTALADCLNQHEFIVIPSIREEPFGIVTLEGIACGCIPIASDGGGLPDAVGNAGVTFKRGDTKALLDCISELYRNTNKRNNLRMAAADHLKNYYPEYIVKQYLEVLENTISEFNTK